MLNYPQVVLERQMVNSAGHESPSLEGWVCITQLRPLNNSISDSLPSFRRKPESSIFNMFWIPDRACPGLDPGSGMTEKSVFQRSPTCFLAWVKSACLNYLSWDVEAQVSQLPPLQGEGWGGDGSLLSDKHFREEFS